jgi:hypothetical protein
VESAAHKLHEFLHFAVPSCSEAEIFTTVAEWFPKNGQVLTAGIFNAGANMDAIITPLIVP